MGYHVFSYFLPISIYLFFYHRFSSFSSPLLITCAALFVSARFLSALSPLALGSGRDSASQPLLVHFRPELGANKGTECILGRNILLAAPQESATNCAFSRCASRLALELLACYSLWLLRHNVRGRRLRSRFSFQNHSILGAN